MERKECTEEEGKSKSAFFLDDPCIINILSRVPTRTLLKFRQVCKHWNNLISEKDIDNGRKRIEETSELLIKYQCSYNILEMGVNEPIKLSFEFNLPKRYMRFIGSANGVVCFFDFKIDKIYISNPLLGEFFALPEFLSRSQSKAAYGFGCSTKNLAYKILRIKKDCPARDTASKNSTAELYSFETGKWMNIGHASYPQDNNGRCGATVHNILHWIIEDPESSDVICSFDIEKEVFGSVQLPSSLKKIRRRIDLKVESLRNTLFVFHGSSMYLHIFSMKEYGVNRSWSQDHKIQKTILPPRAPPLRTSELQPITMWRDKFLFSAPQGPLVSYNSKTNVFAELNIIGMPSGFQGFEYLSTFLSLKESVKVETIALWKKVNAQTNYVHIFVQSTFNALSAEKIRGTTLVVSGDGHNFSKDAIQIIIKMAAANGVRRVWVGQNGLLSTPAVSAVLRERTGSDGSKAKGAFILTASHKPGGPNEGFGIKYMENGGPAPEGITDKILEKTKALKVYLITEGLPDVDLSSIGTTNFVGPEGQFNVDVFDSASDYVKLMKSVFDFQSIQKLLSLPKFTFCYDALHGVAGAYAKHIFVEELGAKESSLLHCTPKEDFGGGHPDPNLTYAMELVARMGLGKSNPQEEPPEFGAAADGDVYRNMIFGKRFFVTPSDSVAIIAANAVHCIPYFADGLKGVPRMSIPTSAAFDVVAKHLNLKLFEVPTGWKSFGNLMDATLCSLCSEESFGTGSDHVCEKDGIWAVLAWLSILAYKNNESLSGGKLVSVEDIVRHHWGTFGRHYYTRYDYENVDAATANELMAYLVKLQSPLSKVNKIVKGIHSDVSDVDNVDEFEYKDFVDGSISKHQGIRYLFSDGSRLVFLLSRTGSEGTTIRLHIEQYEKDSSKTGRDSQTALAPLVEVALKLSKMEEFTGQSKPTRMIRDDMFLQANNC